jgi:hypothetical protein
MGLICVSSCLAQTQVPPAHQRVAGNPAPTIDGSAHPELIPDSTAYRLWLVVVSLPANASEEDKKRQAGHLAPLGLRDADRQALVTILAEFKSQYASLIDQYNQSAEAAMARNELADIETFLLRRDALVQSTRDALKRALSPDAWDRVDLRVQGEKKRMKVSPREAQ